MLHYERIKFSSHHLGQLLIVREVSVVDGSEVSRHNLIQGLLAGVPIHLAEWIVQILVLAGREIGEWRSVSATIWGRVSILERILILNNLRSLPSRDRTLKLLCVVEVKFPELVRVVRITVFCETCKQSVPCRHAKRVRYDEAFSVRAQVLIL